MIQLHQLEQFTNGLSHMTTYDVECSGWPVKDTTAENIEKTHDMAMEDIKFKVHEIAKTIRISNKWVNHLHDHLYMQN